MSNNLTFNAGALLRLLELLGLPGEELHRIECGSDHDLSYALAAAEDLHLREADILHRLRELRAELDEVQERADALAEAELDA
jgi:hypothetical protein